MNDKFLYQLHEEPSPEFAKNLRQRLAQPAVNSERRLTVTFPALTLTRKATWARIGIVLAASLTLLMIVSPMRAFVASLLDTISVSGQMFEVTDYYPGDNYGDVTVIEPQILTLADALALFPHQINLPTYTPSGYALDEDHVWVYSGEDAGSLADTVELTWFSADEGVTLRITNRVSSLGEIVAPNSVEEISLDPTHPAVAIRGGWDVDKKAWTDEYGSVRLRWLVGDLTYELIGTDLTQLTEVALSTLN